MKHQIPDPSADDMREHLRSSYGDNVEDFDIEAAIYWFAYDYHEGQGSHLYNALCNSEYKPGRLMSSAKDEGDMVEILYEELEANFY